MTTWFGRRIVVEQHHDAVFVALVEHARRGQHALARADALVLVDDHSHDVLLVAIVVVS
jgi:hypothetical protein